MSQFISDELVPVRVGDCLCPGSPHDGTDGRDDGDYAYLRPALTLDAGLEVLRALRKAEEGEDEVAFATRMIPPYLHHGLAAWNFVDDHGKPVPLSRDKIDHLDWEVAYRIGDKADDLYGEKAIRPFLPTPPRSLPAGRTAGSTSASRRSPRPRQRPSGPSSPGTSGVSRRSA